MFILYCVQICDICVSKMLHFPFSLSLFFFCLGHFDISKIIDEFFVQLL